MAVAEDVKSEVRLRLGNPSTAELPSEQIDASVEGALREFSRFYPEEREITVALVAGQADYDLPAGVIGVVDSALDNASNPVVTPYYDPEIPFNALYQNAESRMQFWSTMADDYVNRRPVLSPTFQVLDGDTPKLRISPLPQYDGDMVLIVELVQEVTTLSRRDIEGIVQWAEGDCLEFIGRKRSKSVTDIPTATGRLKLSDGREFREEGAKLKRLQEMKWGACASTALAG